jgi:hypothetical protein
MIIVISLILYIIITSLYIKSKFNIIDIEFENRLDVLNERRKIIKKITIITIVYMFGLVFKVIY